MSREVVVVGAGIVGASVARELVGTGFGVRVLERDLGPARGSTALAPGFVGLHNDAPVLTDLARSSLAAYRSMPEGFASTGGLEVATSPEGVRELERRAAAARSAGLPAEVEEAAALPAAVRSFVDVDQVLAAAWFPADGVAVPVELTRAVREVAVAGGARFEHGEAVTGIEGVAGGIQVSTASGRRLVADDVVLAGGVWGPGLARLTGVDLPLVPVSHPYVYAAADARHAPGPFVRWPEHHVYARVHVDRLGIGSYDHLPVPVDEVALREGAGLPWDVRFDPVVARARQLLRAEARSDAQLRVNGVFAMTPDNLPFLGPHPDLPGVWMAQAIWVTHAGGAAVALAAALRDGTGLPPELATDRFAGRGADELRASALRLYRDIYAHDAR